VPGREHLGQSIPAARLAEVVAAVLIRLDAFAICSRWLDYPLSFDDQRSQASA
jgi:hypothetical protein